MTTRTVQKWGGGVYLNVNFSACFTKKKKKKLEIIPMGIYFSNTIIQSFDWQAMMDEAFFLIFIYWFGIGCFELLWITSNYRVPEIIYQPSKLYSIKLESY